MIIKDCDIAKILSVKASKYVQRTLKSVFARKFWIVPKNNADNKIVREKKFNEQIRVLED